MIPKIAHIIIVGEDTKFLHDKLLITLSSITRHMPKHRIKVWTLQNIEFELPTNIQYYAEEGLYAFVADYIKGRILWEYGGWYFDVGVEVFRSFDDISDEKVVVGMGDWGEVLMSVIGAEPKQIAFKYLQRRMESRYEPNTTGMSSEPMKDFTEIITKILNEDERMLYGFETFHPFVVGRDGSIEDIRKKITEKNYACKYPNYSWARGKDKFLYTTKLGGMVLDFIRFLKK